ncbi:MAG TPA: hypothetical protein VJ727_11025 [Rhodanobacteraceae bacterium]|nr:hypothetical protein [Rhodanobacteraceae bacterium]
MPENADELALGVIVALPAEAAGLPGRDLGCEVFVAGIGCERARSAAARAIGRGARGLLNWGVAGGLFPQLHSGDLLLPRHVVSERGEWPIDDRLHMRLLGAVPGVQEIDALYCSNTPVTSLERKRELADRGFAAVDMESAGVAMAASEAGLPFAVLKAVCDPASRAVPVLALRMLDQHGRLRVPALLEATCAGPRAWQELRALRGDFTAARASLRRAAQSLSLGAEAIVP